MNKILYLTISFPLFFFLPFISSSQTVEAYLDSLNQAPNDSLKLYFIAKALESEPRNPELYEQRAYIKWYHHLDHKGAIDDFTIAIKYSPEEAKYYQCRGYNKFMISDNIGAIQDLTKAIKYDSLNAEYFNSRGQYKWHVNDLRGAISDFSTAIKLDSIPHYHYTYRADTYMMLKEFQKANTDYSKGISLALKKAPFPNKIQKESFLSDAYFERGVCKFKLKDFRGCISDFNETLKYAPDYFYMIEDLYIYKGLAKIQIGNLNEGCLDLSKAGELGSSEAYDYISQYCN